MLTRQITLKRGALARAVNISEDKEIQSALTYVRRDPSSHLDSFGLDT